MNVYTLSSHVSIFNGQYNGYLWPCVAIWVVDRLARIARIMLVNISTHKQPAMAVYCADSDIIRLDVFHSKILKPHAGSYYFVYVFNGPSAYESHPFTLASWQENSKTVEPQPTLSLSASSQFQSTKPALLASEVQQTDEVQAQPRLSFIIRPRDGFTSRLRDSIMKSGTLGSPTSVTVLAEGPYGSAAPVDRFQNILLIVGGSGITVALSYLQGIFEKISDREHGTNIHVIWSTRQRKFADEIVKNDMQRYHSCTGFKLDVYITSCSTTPEIKAQQGTSNFYEGRPHIKNTVLREAEKQASKLAVLVCGPPQLADDTRHAVVTALKRGYHWVEFFQQGFSW
jgi:predicted ferric reductase